MSARYVNEVAHVSKFYFLFGFLTILLSVLHFMSV